MYPALFQNAAKSRSIATTATAVANAITPMIVRVGMARCRFPADYNDKQLWSCLRDILGTFLPLLLLCYSGSLRPSDRRGFPGPPVFDGAGFG